MLYIWPYIIFFSIPLLYPYLLNTLVPHRLLPPALRSSPTKTHRLPRSIIALPTIAAMLSIVHYNTIVHPFTLADNRHYTFYVFRILLRHPAIKYLAVPIYFICAWAAISGLGGSTEALSARKREKQPQYWSPASKRSSLQQRSPGGPRASFLLLWLLATAASVIAAPLVEPRYFIVPWLIWRIHVTDSLGDQPGNVAEDDNSQSIGRDHRLWLETAWFLCINVGIGYMFLYRGFEWPQEPGVVQRFMW